MAPGRGRALIATGTVVAVLVGMWWWRWARGAVPGSDGRLLLAVARSVAEGAGPRLPDGDVMWFRGPVWPAAAGTVLRLAGADAGPALIRAGGAAVLAVALAGLGRHWYGWAVGLTAVALAGTTAPPVLAVLADWYTDPLAVALALGALIVLDRALAERSDRHAFAAGVLLAVAVLTKESTGFVAVGPVAASVALADRHGWGFLHPVAVAAATATGLVGPWLTLHVAGQDRFFLTLVEGERARVLLAGWWLLVAVLTVTAIRWRRAGPERWRRPGPRTAVLVATVVVACWAAVVFAGLAGGVPRGSDGRFGTWEILRRFLLPALGPAPLVALGAVVLGRAAVRRERSALAHAAALGAFLPLLVVWPLSGSVFVARNGLVAVLLVHLAAAAGTARVLGAVRRRAAAAVVRPALGPVILAAAAVTVVVVVATSAAATWRAVPDRPPNRFADLDAAAAWLRSRLDPGEAVIGSYLAWTRLAWQLGPAHPVHLLPSSRVRLDTSGRLRSVPVVPVVGTPRRVDVPSGTDDWLTVLRHPDKAFITALSRDRLVAELRDAPARYLVLWGASTRDGEELAVTLEAMAGVERAAMFGWAIVLAVDADRLATAPVPPAAARAQTLDWLSRRGGGCERRTVPALGWPPRPATIARCGRLLLHGDRPRRQSR